MTKQSARDCGPDAISQRLEAALVARNPRGMADVRAALAPGYLLRSARQILATGPRVAIATGFPVLDNIETDGPAGALALYDALRLLGRHPEIFCETTLQQRLPADINSTVLPLEIRDCQSLLGSVDALVTIERPGHAGDGRYYNMRGEDISTRVSPIDIHWRPSCPLIAIGDGGNEWGMGKLGAALQPLHITPSISVCDELIVADVSNWGAYGLIAMLEYLTQKPLISTIDPVARLTHLAAQGIIDGVSRRAEVSEDGLPADVGLRLVRKLQMILSE